MVVYFLKNFFFLLLLNVLIKPIWVFLIDIPVQNAVGHEAYGIYFTAFNFAYIFSIISDLGLNHYNNIHLADKSIDKEFSISAIFPFKIFITAAYIAIASLAAISVFESPEIRYFVLLTSLFHSFTSILLFLRTYLSSHRKFKHDSVFSVFDKLFSTIILGIVLYVFGGHGITIQQFILIQLISLFFVIFILMYSLRESWSWRIGFSVRDLHWIRDAWPYTALILLMGIYTRIDSTLIQLILDERQAGIYAASFRLLDFLSQFGYLSSVILLPLFSSLKSTPERASSLLSHSSVFMLIIASLISFFMVLYATRICEVLYQSDSINISRIFVIHLIAYPLIVVNFIVGSYITALKYIRFLIIISSVGVLIQLIGNLLLLSKVGLIGAGIVMIATHLWILVAQIFWIIYRHKKFSLFGWESVFIFSFGICALPALMFHRLLAYIMLLIFGMSVAVWIVRRRKLIRPILFDQFFTKFSHRN